MLLLLHGFPASSFMFRELIAQLSDKTFAYTFDRLAAALSQPA